MTTAPDARSTTSDARRKPRRRRWSGRTRLRHARAASSILRWSIRAVIMRAYMRLPPWRPEDPDLTVVVRGAGQPAFGLPPESPPSSFTTTGLPGEYRPAARPAVSGTFQFGGESVGPVGGSVSAGWPTGPGRTDASIGLGGTRR